MTPCGCKWIRMKLAKVKSLHVLLWHSCVVTVLYNELRLPPLSTNLLSESEDCLEIIKEGLHVVQVYKSSTIMTIRITCQQREKEFSKFSVHDFWWFSAFDSLSFSLCPAVLPYRDVCYHYCLMRVTMKEAGRKKKKGRQDVVLPTQLQWQLASLGAW